MDKMLCHLFLISLLAVCSYLSAVRASWDASGSSDHDCPTAPAVPGDRRADKVSRYNRGGELKGK